jgi:hypothetical protein
VSLDFDIFGIIWTNIELTCGSVWMACVNLYMTYPNERMTHGSMDDRWLYRC